MINKPILSIETSGSICGTSVYFSEDISYSVNIILKNIHAEKIFDAINFVMDSAGVEAQELSAVAVSSGPGSFTGLRIGMSAAKGIAFGASLPVIPVPTFEAFAMQITSYLPDNSTFAIATKVNADEIYFAKFQIKMNNFIFAEQLQIIKKNELGKRIEDCAAFGNAVSGSRILVPGPEFIAKYALMHRERLTADFDYLEPDYLKNFIIPSPGKAGR